MTDLVVRAPLMVTCECEKAQHDLTLADLGVVRDAAVVCSDERIAWRGRIDDLPAAFRHGEIVEFGEGVLLPGLIDAHAHPLYWGNREPDFRARQLGESPPLGMLSTVERTRDALEHPDRLWAAVHSRLEMMLAHGTTTLEVKTGYALHAPGEMQLLSLVDAHRDDPDVPSLIATFLGAHIVPPEFPDEVAYVDYLIDQCLPLAAAHGARYADVFCEPGYFSRAQSRRYLQAAAAHGLRLRSHCDEFAHEGAAAMAAGLGADSVDHCNRIRDDEIAAIVDAGSVVVACPATIVYLGLTQQAPVARILEAGGTVALASDFNPGTSPCFNLQTVAYFGRSLFGLNAAQALYAVTVAAARSLGARAGRIAQDAPADLVLMQIEAPDEFGWQFGGNLLRAVVHRGRLRS